MREKNGLLLNESCSSISFSFGSLNYKKSSDASDPTKKNESMMEMFEKI